MNLMWNLLRSFFNPGHSKSTRFPEAGGKVSSVVADVISKQEVAQLYVVT